VRATSRKGPAMRTLRSVMSTFGSFAILIVAMAAGFKP
jgi:hypothetical protein